MAEPEVARDIPDQGREGAATIDCRARMQDRVDESYHSNAILKHVHAHGPSSGFVTRADIMFPSNRPLQEVPAVELATDSLSSQEGRLFGR